jgi:hypothetical protein
MSNGSIIEAGGGNDVITINGVMNGGVIRTGGTDPTDATLAGSDIVKIDTLSGTSNTIVCSVGSDSITINNVTSGAAMIIDYFNSTEGDVLDLTGTGTWTLAGGGTDWTLTQGSSVFTFTGADMDSYASAIQVDNLIYV